MTIRDTIVDTILETQSSLRKLLKIPYYNTVNGGFEYPKGTAINAVTYTSLTDVNLPSPVGRKGLVVYLDSPGLHGSIWVSDGTLYWPLNGAPISIDVFAENKYAVFVESTFGAGSVLSYNGGADTKVTGVGVHGLTAAKAEGNYVYVSGGAGWTVGLHKVLDVDLGLDTIILDTPWDNGFGPVTLAPKATKIPYRTIALPGLREQSVIKVDLSTNSDSGAVGSKTYNVELVATPFWTATSTANTGNATNNITIQNVGSQSVQIGALSSNTVSQVGTTSTQPATGAIDTSVTTNLILYMQNAAANEKVGYTRGIVEVRI